MRGLTTRYIAMMILAAGMMFPGRVSASGMDVLYRDQTGAAFGNLDSHGAAAIASARVGFTVRLPRSWPRSAPLRALWVMERYNPPFVVLYYGSAYGSIACQLHESPGVTKVMMSWAPQAPIEIGQVQGLELRSWSGAVELIWRSHGIRFDLLGSDSTSPRTLLAMARSLL